MWPLCSALLGSPCCSGTTYRDQSSLTQTLRGTRVRTWHWDLRFSLPGLLLTLLTSWETHSSVLVLPCPGSPGQTQAPDIVKGSQAMNRETEDSFVQFPREDGCSHGRLFVPEEFHTLPKIQTQSRKCT